MANMTIPATQTKARLGCKPNSSMDRAVVTGIAEDIISRRTILLLCFMISDITSPLTA